MNIHELLKNEVGLSEVEVNKYLDTRENETNFVMKLRDKAWLETATYRALQLAVEKHGGKYEPRPPTWTIPKDGSNPTPQTPSTTQADPESETEDGYDLKGSATGLGELAPILKDAQGNIIDGFHRKVADPNWISVTVASVDNPVKLELARLAVNFCRRRVPKMEMQERIAFLVGKAGLKPEEIAEKTGISKRTIYNYLPQGLKNQTKVDSGRMGGESSAAVRTSQDSGASLHQTEKDSDAPSRSESIPKMEHAAPESVPKSQNFQETADLYMRQLVKCDGCGVYAHQSKIEVVNKKNLCLHCANPPKSNNVARALDSPLESAVKATSAPAENAKAPNVMPDAALESIRKETANEYKTQEAKRDELIKKIVEFCPESVAKWTVDAFGVDAFGKKAGKNREEAFATFLTIVIDLQHSVLVKHGLLDEVKAEAAKWK